jgi:hypothetical protein
MVFFVDFIVSAARSAVFTLAFSIFLAHKKTSRLLSTQKDPATERLVRKRR